MASVSCASRERAPRDMPPVAMRSTVASIGSTSASVSGIGPRADAISSMLRVTVTAVTVTCSSFKLSFRSSTSLIVVGVCWLELQSPGSLYTSSISYFPATPMLGRPSPSVSSRSRVGVGLRVEVKVRGWVRVRAWVSAKARVRAKVRVCHGWAREAERRPRRTDVAPGATEAALVGGVARPLQADHEAGAKGLQASFELGGGRGGRHIAERGEGEEHGCAVVVLCSCLVVISRGSWIMQQRA
eukprot:scaffold5992_cov66-Phaeocystis_antarctica.AAC.6